MKLVGYADRLSVQPGETVRFMVSANVAVAAELSRSNTPTLYRVHGKPEEQKLDRLLATLTTLGIDAQDAQLQLSTLVED